MKTNVMQTTPTPSTSKVYITRCSDYSPEQVSRTLEHLLAPFAGLINPGYRVLIKPNILSAKPPESAVDTHPEIVAQLAIWVSRLGGKPVVGDSSGGVIPGSNRTRKSLRISGIAEAAARAGAEVINFDTAGTVKRESPRKQGRDDGSRLPDLWLSNQVFDSDLIINVPKFKTHTFAYFTGAVKNLYGCVPGAKKSEYHALAPSLKGFSQILADILELIRPAINVMDAVVGMEGNGPAAGNPRHMGLLLASGDPVALDAACCRIIGIEPGKVPVNAICEARGLGNCAETAISYPLLTPGEVAVRGFKTPRRSYAESVPDRLGRAVLGFVKTRPEVDPDRCTGCGLCYHSCPVKTIHMVETGSKGKAAPKRAVIDHSECIDCLCCHELCPENAITLRYASRLARMLLRSPG